MPADMWSLLITTSQGFLFVYEGWAECGPQWGCVICRVRLIDLM